MGMFGGKRPAVPGIPGLQKGMPPKKAKKGATQVDQFMAGLRSQAPQFGQGGELLTESGMVDTATGELLYPEPVTIVETKPKQWDDFVGELVENRKDEDDIRWTRGYILVEMCEKLGFDPRPGRPAANQNVRTLAELAAEVNISAKRLSEAYVNAAYYGNSRTFGEYGTWAHHDQARRHAEDLPDALRMLKIAEEKHLHFRAFVRWLDGIVYEGEVTREQLIATWDSYVQSGKRIFMTLQVMED